MSGEVIRLNIIEVYNLKFKDIFEDLSLVIPENTIVSISGPNNCGKTTLIRILSREIITENILIKYPNQVTDDLEVNLILKGNNTLTAANHPFHNPLNIGTLTISSSLPIKSISKFLLIFTISPVLYAFICLFKIG